jgi:hypothetical protein
MKKRQSSAAILLLLPLLTWSVVSTADVLTFQSVKTFPAGIIVPSSVATADFNLDGKLDVVAYDGGTAISVLLGNGDGTLQTVLNYPVLGGIIEGYDQTHKVAVGDFNADGIPDIVSPHDAAAGTGHGINVLIGKGDGTFQPNITFPSALAPDCVLNNLGTQYYAIPITVTTADVDGDGKLDVVAGNTGGGCGNGSIDVYFGNGDGTFQSPVSLDIGSSALIANVTAADLNGDGITDIAAAVNTANAAFVFLGNGNKTFQSPASIPVGTSPSAIASFDLDGDAKPDLITANAGAGTVSVLIGNGDGTFKSQQNYIAGTTPVSLKIADMNGDGKLDILTADNGGIRDKMDVLLGNGDGTFQSRQEIAATDGATALTTGTVADLNKDGILDLVAAGTNLQSGLINVLLGSGSTNNSQSGSNTNTTSNSSPSSSSSGGGGGGSVGPEIFAYLALGIFLLQKRLRLASDTAIYIAMAES